MFFVVRGSQSVHAGEFPWNLSFSRRITGLLRLLSEFCFLFFSMLRIIAVDRLSVSASQSNDKRAEPLSLWERCRESGRHEDEHMTWNRTWSNRNVDRAPRCVAFFVLIVFCHACLADTKDTPSSDAPASQHNRRFKVRRQTLVFAE